MNVKGIRARGRAEEMQLRGEPDHFLRSTE